MRPVQVGPGRNNYVPKRDAGKFAAAADTKGFRMTVRDAQLGSPYSLCSSPCAPRIDQASLLSLLTKLCPRGLLWAVDH